jgi:spore coat polysaccharide biosynthesis predicted glycosyltransferase SpsG
MKIIFRVDAYPEIGLGHFVRSIAIALELKKNINLKIVFAGEYSAYSLNELKGNNVNFISPGLSENEEDFMLRFLDSEKPNLIFIDNLFNYSATFLHEVKGKAKVILFQNLCDGKYQADAFILPSAHHPVEIINDAGWQKNDVEFYHGFDYIPVNDHIKNIILHEPWSASGHKISLTTGGSDPRGVMLQMISWLMKNDYSDIHFVVLPGENFILKKELENLKQKTPVNFIFKKFNYSDLESSDLAICTFGVTSYELIYLGIPFISIGHAENNARGSRILSGKLPFMKDLGLIDDLQEDVFHAQLKDFLSNPTLKTEFRETSRTLMDGKGINRIIGIILNQLYKN